MPHRRLANNGMIESAEEFIQAMLREIWHGTGLSKPVIERDGAHWRLVQWQPNGTSRLLGWGSYN
jgi:hypothetical protein